MKPTPPTIKGLPSRIFHVEAAGCRFRVKSIDMAPAKKNPTLVFLHEGLGCIELWRDFPQAVCESTGCNGLIYDRKGYGGSDTYGGPWPTDYLTIESQTYLPALLEACNIKDAVLIGHSDGGTIALLAASFCGERIRGLITEAAHIFVEDITLEGIRRAVQAFETTDLKDRLARYHHENTDTVFSRWANRWLSLEFCNWNVEEYLPKITCPLLVLQGEDDEYGTAAQVQRIVSGVSGPVKARLIPRCGHVPHFQARGTVLSEMTNLIKSLIISSN